MSSKRTFLVEGGDHALSSVQQTQTVIDWTVERAEALRDGTAAHFSHSKLGENRGIPVASTAN